MNIRTSLSVAMCRLSRFAIRMLGRGGTDYPGKIALRVYPEVLGELAKGVTTIIVTGTNGKTTTSRMIEQALANSGIRYFANKSGANLLSGITAEFAMHATLFGENKYDYALIECDEAAFKAVSNYVDAKCVVVTNIFRDQLDRYGEITHTLNNIKIGLSHSPNATVCINADCSLSASIAGDIPNPVIFYGIEGEIYHNRVREVSDAPYCIRCMSEYEYDYVTYGHLGGYRCPNCGYSRPKTDISVESVIESGAERSVVEMKIYDSSYIATINLPGGYNIYNGAAAAAVGRAMGLDDQTVISALSDFECGFGRMEKFTIENTDLRMILIKNPAGCNQVLNFLSNIDQKSLFVIALNDRSADGTDISWIWDVDFEKLEAISGRLSGIYVSGIRADDMALRLRYAGISEKKLEVVKDYGELITKMLAQDAPVYIMPTYTAMLDLREKISKTFGFKDFWE